MKTDFIPNGLPTLVGSIPLSDHGEAADLILEHMPEIPLWAQLPSYPQEGMIPQFVPGLPGLKNKDDKLFVDSKDPGFDEEILAFYEEYMAVVEGVVALDDSRFVSTPKEANGLFTLAEKLKGGSEKLVAVKGQVTGPFTLMTGTTDEAERAIFYNDQLRDAASKLLALKAKWQAKFLNQFGKPVFIFLDEPALAGFGTSAYISVTADEVKTVLKESIDALHEEGALAGVHVCANTDWSLVMDSGVDIVNFDAYGYFDKFFMYKDAVKQFLDRGGILAWGVAPTLSAQELEKETEDSIYDKWKQYATEILNLGIDKKTLLTQSLITPSCGTGSLTLEFALKAIKITRAVSERARSEFAV